MFELYWGTIVLGVYAACRGYDYYQEQKNPGLKEQREMADKTARMTKKQLGLW